MTDNPALSTWAGLIASDPSETCRDSYHYAEHLGMQVANLAARSAPCAKKLNVG
jgi:hypothetical protein